MARALDPKKEYRRILVLNRLHIGDCILTTPTLRALRERFPHAEIHAAVPKGSEELLSENPNIDELILRPHRTRWAAKFAFAFWLKRQQYDLIVSFQEKSVFYALSTGFSGAESIGLDHPRTRRYYRHTVPVREDRHEVYKYLAVAELLGCDVSRPYLELIPSASAREQVAAFLTSRGYAPDARFVAVNPGATTADKRWAAERFAEVAQRLQAELNLPAVVLGGPDDRERAEFIASQCSPRPLIAAGETSLGGTAALLQRCDVLVTSDTGPMHMAVGVGTPVVAVFGPTSVTKFRPFTKRSRVLYHAEPCADCTTPCTHTVTPDEAVEAALQLVARET